MNNIQKMTVAIIFASMIFVVTSPTQASYNSGREQYQKEKAFYNKSRNQFLKEKELFNKTKNIENRAKYEEAGKKHLIKIIDILIAKLDRIEKWTNNRSAVALSDAEKNEIITEINEDRTWLKTKQNKIENANGAEIRRHAKDVKEYWLNNRVNLKKIIGHVLAGRAEYAVDRMETASTKLESAIVKAENAGKDVTDAKKLLDELNVKIEQVKEDIESAKKAFHAISSRQDGDRFFQQGKDYLKKANNNLREAHKIAKDIITDLRT